MALTRVSEKKIAANRRNAQKSTGPRTPAGKARSSRNACVHYAFAQVHRMPESWDAGLCQQAAFAVRDIADPIRRAFVLDYVYHAFWQERLIVQERQLLANCAERFPTDPKRAAHLFTFDPGIRAFRRQLRRVERLLHRAGAALLLHLNPPARSQPARRSARSKAAASGLAINDLLIYLMKLKGSKPHRKQNKQPLVCAAPRNETQPNPDSNRRPPSRSRPELPAAAPQSSSPLAQHAQVTPPRPSETSQATAPTRQPRIVRNLERRPLHPSHHAPVARPPSRRPHPQSPGTSLAPPPLRRPPPFTRRRRVAAPNLFTPPAPTPAVSPLPPGPARC